MKTSRILIFLLLGGMWHAAWGQLPEVPVTNVPSPVHDWLVTESIVDELNVQYPLDVALLWFEMDMDGDGLEDQWVTREDNIIWREGNQWYLYLNNGDETWREAGYAAWFFARVGEHKGRKTVLAGAGEDWTAYYWEPGEGLKSDQAKAEDFDLTYEHQVWGQRIAPVTLEGEELVIHREMVRRELPSGLKKAAEPCSDFVDRMEAYWNERNVLAISDVAYWRLCLVPDDEAGKLLYDLTKNLYVRGRDVVMGPFPCLERLRELERQGVFAKGLPLPE